MFIVIIGFMPANKIKVIQTLTHTHTHTHAYHLNKRKQESIQNRIKCYKNGIWNHKNRSKYSVFDIVVLLYSVVSFNLTWNVNS